MNRRRPLTRATTVGAFALVAFAAISAPAIAGGKLLATGGVSTAEGAGGGALAPWALVGGYETRDEIGATAFFSHAGLTGYALDSGGISVGLFDRLELSYARQTLSIDNGITSPIAAGLGLPNDALNGTTISQDVYGAKIKLLGNAVFGPANSVLPQVSLGAEFKVNGDYNVIPKALGARHAAGTDVYLAATKIVLAGAGGYNLLVNATVRETKANALGLLGFGGDTSDAYHPQFEGSAAVLFNPQTAFGVEYRTTPNNLSATRSDSYKDVFVAFFPSKHLSITAGYLDVGNLPGGFSAAGVTRQQTSGLYLSSQVAVP